MSLLEEQRDKVLENCLQGQPYLLFAMRRSNGDQIQIGQPFGTIESVKAVSELYAPVSGEVTEVHDALVDQPELVNDDPHGEAWMIRIKIADSSQLDGLMSAAEYTSFLEAAADAG